MRVRQVGTYRETGAHQELNSGLHVEAAEIKGPYRFQSIDTMLLSEEEKIALRAGKEIDLPWLSRSELLNRIDS